jgi:hypothetical protein
MNILQCFPQKNLNCFCCNIVQFFVIKNLNLDPDPDSQKNLDPVPYSMNMDPQYYSLRVKKMRKNAAMHNFFLDFYDVQHF